VQIDVPSAEPNNVQQEAPASNTESPIGPSDGLMGDHAFFLAGIPDSAEPNDVQHEEPASNTKSPIGPSDGLMGDHPVFLDEISDYASSHSPFSQYEADYSESIKQLKKRIDTLRHDASETRKAFKCVEKIVEKMVPSDEQRDELRKLWQEGFEVC